MTHCVVVLILVKWWHFQFSLLSRSDYKLSWKKSSFAFKAIMVNVLLKLMKLSQVNKQEILCPAKYCQQSLIDIPQTNCMFSLLETFLVRFASDMRKKFFTFHSKVVLIPLNKTFFMCCNWVSWTIQFGISVLSRHNACLWLCVWIFLIPSLSGKMTFFSSFGKTQQISTFTWHWWAFPNKVNRVKIRTVYFSVCLHMFMCLCSSEGWCKQMLFLIFCGGQERQSTTFTLFFKKFCYVTNALRQRWCLLCVFFASSYNVCVIKKYLTSHNVHH